MSGVAATLIGLSVIGGAVTAALAMGGWVARLWGISSPHAEDRIVGFIILVVGALAVFGMIMAAHDIGHAIMGAVR